MRKGILCPCVSQRSIRKTKAILGFAIRVDGQSEAYRTLRGLGEAGQQVVSGTPESAEI